MSINSSSDPAHGNTALIIAHPGHELRVHHWLTLARPTVFVLTDGSGHTRQSRLRSTGIVLDNAGATRGTIYGDFTDAQLYAAILACDTVRIGRVVRDLANALAEANVDYVVADALEGFNPSHDICRFAVNAALALLQQQTGRAPRNFDVLLDGNPDACPEHLQASAMRIELHEAALARKLAAAQNYPELRAETASALERFGTEAFRVEYLRPVLSFDQGLEAMEPEPPYYERYGEQQVAAGYYDRVIRYREHMQPLVQAVWRQLGLRDQTTVNSASALT